MRYSQKRTKFMIQAGQQVRSINQIFVRLYVLVSELSKLSLCERHKVPFFVINREIYDVCHYQGSCLIVVASIVQHNITGTYSLLLASQKGFNNNKTNTRLEIWFIT